MLRTLRSALRIALVAGATLLGVAKPAEAILWQGDFDPLFFMGSAIFEVPLTCYDTNPGLNFVDVVGSSCGSVDLVSAVVRDYQPGANPPPPIDQLFWGLNPGVVKGLLWNSGQLAGVDLYPAVGPSTPGTGSYFGVGQRYYLTFNTGLGSAPSGVPTGTALYQQVCYTTGAAVVCFPSPEAIDVAQNITFRRIPEPAPLALIGLALGAWAVAGRRRGRAAR